MPPSAGALITEALSGHGREVTAYVPPQPVDVVVYAADGGWHTARLAEALERGGATSTMVVGVHGQPDDDGRLHEYVLGFDDEQFAAHEADFVGGARRWAADRFDVAPPADRTAVWGASLGAELALAMGLRHPDVYGVVLAASPDGGFTPPPDLPTALPRTYLVAGDDEPFFLANATRWADALRDAGGDVALARRPGEHGGAFWYEELLAMLTWAFGGSTEVDDPARQ